MAISDTHVVDSLYPRVEKSLKNRSNVTKLIKYISNYFDRNGKILFDLNFSDRLVISTEDQEIINRITGITSKEVAKIISESRYVAKLSWTCTPFTVMMAMAIRYFAKNRMTKEIEASVPYLTCLFYTLRHTSSFKFLPKKEIMDYTLYKNPKVTNSFKIKQLGTVFGLIRYTGITSHEFYIKELTGECTDVQLNNYLSGIRTRIGSNLKNLANYFYKDWEAGHFFNKDSDSYEETNYHIADSTMLAIAKLSSKVSINLASHGFSRDAINRSANSNINVSSTKLSHILDNIIHYHRNDLEKFAASVIELFVLEGNNPIREVSTLKFLAHSLRLYKTNSTRPKVIEIKRYLDKWIEDGSSKFGNKFVRQATVNAYRECLFTVFVYTINKESK